MRVLLINPPHPAVSSRCHSGQMPPFGLLCVGGPLLDAGHEVELMDGELGPLSVGEIVQHTIQTRPQLILIGHSGSTSAHPLIVDIAKALKQSLADVPLVYGGVYPTYHAKEILDSHTEFDFIVRGEGEATTVKLVDALERAHELDDVGGIAFRRDGMALLTHQARTIADLNDYRVGWELIRDWDPYQYWGAGRAAVIQFSRGCPHQCNYCGQRGFWSRWRHRDPAPVAAEIGWLHRQHGVGFVDLADENPTSSKRLWQQFLEALIEQNVDVQLVATIRAGDIVRDADILPLYKRAGFSRILMGIETTDEATLQQIRKGTTTNVDREAIALLRKHDILSQAAYVVGFQEETDRDYVRGIRQLISYDPDQINAMYVTPHRWTPFYQHNAQRDVVETDPAKWDYRHQVLATQVPPWRVFLWVKLTEAILQLRPRALWRVATHRDRKIRRAIRWCYSVGRRAWQFEVREFIIRKRKPTKTVSLEEFWGSPDDENECALSVQRGKESQSPDVVSITHTRAEMSSTCG